ERGFQVRRVVFMSRRVPPPHHGRNAIAPTFSAKRPARKNPGTGAGVWSLPARERRPRACRPEALFGPRKRRAALALCFATRPGPGPCNLRPASQGATRSAAELAFVTRPVRTSTGPASCTGNLTGTGSSPLNRPNAIHFAQNPASTQPSGAAEGAND